MSDYIIVTGPNLYVLAREVRAVLKESELWIPIGAPFYNEGVAPPRAIDGKVWNQAMYKRPAEAL